MTVELPEDLRELLQAEVDDGRYPSLEAAVIEAVRRLVGNRYWWRRLPGPFTGSTKEFVDMMEGVDEMARKRRQDEGATPGTDPVIGSMREFADDVDEMVEDALRRRREEARWSMPDE